MKITTVIAAACMAAAFAGPSKAQTKLVLAHHSSIDSHNAKQAERFKACVEVKSAGRLQVAHYPAGQLGNARETVEQLKLGAIDATITDTAYLSNVQPELAAFQLPFIFADWGHAERAMDGQPGKTAAAFLAEKQGIRVLAYMHNGFRDFMTVKKPITAIDSFKGMKLRSPPIPIWLKMFELLGAVPVAVDWSEIYTAMQSNLAEGMESTPEGLISSRTYEVVRHVTQTQHMYNLMMLVMNERKFTTLQPAEKAALTDCAAEFRQKGNPEAIQLNDEAYGFAKSKGIQIYQIDKAPLRSRLEAAWPQLVGSSKGGLELIEQIAKLR